MLIVECQKALKLEFNKNLTGCFTANKSWRDALRFYRAYCVFTFSFRNQNSGVSPDI